MRAERREDLEIGNVWPITPVDMTSVSEADDEADDDNGLGEGVRGGRRSRGP